MHGLVNSKHILNSLGRRGGDQSFSFQFAYVSYVIFLASPSALVSPFRFDHFALLQQKMSQFIVTTWKSALHMMSFLYSYKTQRAPYPLDKYRKYFSIMTVKPKRKQTVMWFSSKADVYRLTVLIYIQSTHIHITCRILRVFFLHDLFLFHFSTTWFEDIVLVN